MTRYLILDRDTRDERDSYWDLDCALADAVIRAYGHPASQLQDDDLTTKAVAARRAFKRQHTFRGPFGNWQVKADRS